MSLWQPPSRPDLPPPADPTPADPTPADLAGEAPAGGAPADGRQGSVTPAGLPTMDQLDRFSAELDGIDAALAQMDDGSSLPAPPPG